MSLLYAYLQKLQVNISNTRVILYSSSLHYIKAKPFTPCLLFFGIRFAFQTEQEFTSIAVPVGVITDATDNMR